jgi:uracil-DNA glycosylase
MGNSRELLVAYFKQQADLDIPAYIFSDSFSPKSIGGKPKKTETTAPSAVTGDLPKSSRKAAWKPLSADKLMGKKKILPSSSALPVSTKRESLAELFRTTKTCQLCGLDKSRQNVVFGSGNADALLMIIGDAPTQEDDCQGKPFCGAIGELLTKMLAAIGIDRTKTFITTTVKCSPPGDRPPQPDEVRACGDILTRQIEIIRPKVILLLGSGTVKALFNGTDSVDDVRSRNGEAFYKTIPTFTTYSPSDIHRDSTYKRPAWEDLQKLQTTLKKAGFYDAAA